jgi:hypothetical protein
MKFVAHTHHHRVFHEASRRWCGLPSPRDLSSRALFESKGCPVPIPSRALLVLIAVCCSLSSPAVMTARAFGGDTPPLSCEFARGNANGDTNAAGDPLVNIADAIFLLAYLFSGGSAPPQRDAADASDDGNVDVADAIVLLALLFQGGAISPPFPGAGFDSTPDGLEPTCPDGLEIVSGNGQSGETGSILAAPLRVRVLSDGNGAPPGIEVEFTVLEGGARSSRPW